MGMKKKWGKGGKKEKMGTCIREQREQKEMAV